MRAVLLSIQPKWVCKILKGEKTIEIRKTAIRNYLNNGLPIEVYVYCTKNKDAYFLRNKDGIYKELKSKVFTCREQKDPNDLTNSGVLNGRVVAKFTLKQITYLGNVATDKWKYLAGSTHEWHKKLVGMACLTEDEMLAYGGEYAWHISDLVIFDKPKELGEFYKKRKCTSCFDSGYEVSACCFDEDCMVPVQIERAPQDWCYVEVDNETNS